jgi:hypothetical protein
MVEVVLGPPGEVKEEVEDDATINVLVVSFCDFLLNV